MTQVDLAAALMSPACDRGAGAALTIVAEAGWKALLEGDER